MKKPGPSSQSSLHENEGPNVKPLITPKLLINSSESTPVIMANHDQDIKALNQKEPKPAVTFSNKSKKADDLP